MKLFKRLSDRLIIIAVIGVLLVSTTFYYYTLSAQRSLFEESFGKSAKGTLETVKLGLEIGLSLESYEPIGKVFEWAKENGDLSFIALFTEGELLAAYPEAETFKLENLESASSNLNLDDSLYILSDNWESEIGGGKLFIGFSTKRIGQYESKLFRDVGFINLIAVIGAVVIVILIAFSITRPLNKLRKVTNSIRKGNEEIRADERRGGLEIESVAKDFNRMIDQLVTTQQILEGELNEAAKFVKTMLPAPLEGNISIDWKFIPSLELGGDSFGYHEIDEKHLAIYLLDVSGHGVGTSLYSTIVLDLLKKEGLPGINQLDPGEVLFALNNSFQMEKYGDNFFTIWYGVLNTNTLDLKYSCGGHPPALVIRDSETTGTRQVIEAGNKNLVIGGLPNQKFETGNFQLQPGDIFYIYSDGIFELLESGTGEMLPWKSFKQMVMNSTSPNESSLSAIILEAQKIQGSDHFSDDCSIMEIRVSKNSSHV